jgi:hypothetical protein
MAIDPVECKLGFTGAVRVKGVPQISLLLQPANPPKTLGSASNLKELLELSGRCENVRSPVPCRITWILESEDGPAGSRRIPHSDPGIIVPDDTSGVLRKTFKLKQAAANSSASPVPVEIDILKVGLYGKGGLGCEIESYLPTQDRGTLAPGESKLRIDTGIGLRLLDLNNQPIGDASGLEVGTQVRVQPFFAPGFANRRVRISIREVGEGYLGERGKPHESTYDVTAGSVPCESMVIGFDGLQFDYRTSPAAQVLEYGYTIQFLKPGADEPIPGSVPVTGTLLKVPKPRLSDFSLSLEPAAIDTAPDDALLDPLPPPLNVFDTWVLAVSGQFEGIAHKHWTPTSTQEDFTIALNASLYARYLEAKGPAATPRYVPIDLPTIAMRVTGGRFRDAFDLRCLSNDARRTLAALVDRQLSFFAVLEFSPTEMGVRAEKLKKGEAPRPIVFANVANYPGASESGLAAMRDRRLTSKELADGVCSNLVDALGNCTPLADDGPW